VYNPRAWLMAHCRTCAKRFSTGIRMETATRYGTRGWNVKCPHCGATQSGERETGAPATSPKHAPLSL